MSTPLPAHIGGYQHLERHVPLEIGDVFVRNGAPLMFVTLDSGHHTVGQAEDSLPDCHVYRKIPVAKQGDIDNTGWRKVKAGSYEGVHQELPDAQCHARPGDEHGLSAGGGGGSSPMPAVQAERVMRRLAGLDGGALPSDAAKRKAIPIYSGFIKYFPRAIAAVAELSRIGNDQHNPGKPLHWDRSKSGDERDALMRHLMQAGTADSDGVLHSTKAAWRAMAALEKELEADDGPHDPHLG